MADLSRVVHFTGVRLSYPNIVTPQVKKNEEGVERSSYGASFLLLPNDPNFAQFLKVVNIIAAEKWDKQAQLVMNHINSDKSKRCYATGDEKINTKTMLPNPENLGHIVIAAYNNAMPQMVDPQANPVDPTNTMLCQAIARKLYAGCRVNVALKPWCQDNKQGKAIRCELVGLQFHSDDKPFGEGHVDLTGVFAPTEGAAPAAPGFAAAPWSPPGAFGAPATAPPAFGAPAAAPVWAAPATAKPSFL